MRLTVTVLLAALALAGCDTPAANEVSRNTAKSVVRGVVANKFPGAPVEPITDCVIDNSTSTELFTFAKAAVTGVTPQTVDTVVKVATRPETIRCLVNSGLTTSLLLAN